MRAGDVSFRTHLGDFVASLDFIARLDRVGRNVAVLGYHTIAVVNNHPLSVARGRACLLNSAVHHCINGRADVIGDVQAVMEFTPALAVPGRVDTFCRNSHAICGNRAVGLALAARGRAPLTVGLAAPA